GWEITAPCASLEKALEIPPDSSPPEFPMSKRSLPAAANETREQRIEALLKELRPKVDAAVRQLVEHVVHGPEAQAFGAIDFEFRDAGLLLANEVRQASVARRKKRVRRVQP